MGRISPQNATSHWFRSRAFPSETRFPAGVLRHAAGSRPFPPSCPNGREQECAHPAHLPFCAPDRPSGYAARRAHGRGELAVHTSSTVGRTDRINSEAVAASTAPTAGTSNAAAGTARTKTAHKASITDRKAYGANMKGSFAGKTKETTAPLPLSKRRRAPEGSPSAAHPPKKSRSWSQGETRPARGC